MTAKKNKEKQEAEETFFDNLSSDVSEQKLLAPPNWWEYFWLNKKLRTLVGVFLILVLVSVVYTVFFRQNLQKSNKLTDYVPSKAMLYVEFDLQGPEWQELLEKTPRLATRLNDFFIKQGLNQEIINSAARLALVAQKSDEATSWSWLIHSNELSQLEVYLSPDSFYRQLSDEVAVITSDLPALRKFEYSPYRFDIDAKPRLLWSGFVRPKLLAENFSKTPESYIYPHVLKSSFRKQATELEFGVILQNNYLVISTDMDGGLLPEQQDYDLVAQAVDLNKELNSLEGVISGLPLANFHWQEFKKATAKNYQFAWSDLKKLLSKPANLIIEFKDPKYRFELLASESLQVSDFNFVIEFTESLTDTEKQLLRDMFRNMFAYNFPLEKKITLPDGTTAYDLVFDPGAFEYFEYNDLAGSAYLKSLDEAQEIILLDIDDNFKISNSVDFMDQYLQSGSDLKLDCVTSSESGIYLSDQLIGQLNLLEDFASAVINSNSSSLNICLEI